MKIKTIYFNTPKKIQNVFFTSQRGREAIYLTTHEWGFMTFVLPQCVAPYLCFFFFFLQNAATVIDDWLYVNLSIYNISNSTFSIFGLSFSLSRRTKTLQWHRVNKSFYATILCMIRQSRQGICPPTIRFSQSDHASPLII